MIFAWVGGLVGLLPTHSNVAPPHPWVPACAGTACAGTTIGDVTLRMAGKPAIM